MPLDRLIASLIAMPLLVTGPALAAPALWQVSDADSRIFLFGSFHILPPDADWRTPLFDDTLASADKVVFETDIGPAAQAAISAKAFVRGMFVDGTLLTDVIGDGTEAEMRRHAEAIGLPLGTILAMRPWMAANTISVAAMTHEGYSLEGVEMTLYPEIDPHRMVFLETGDQQLDVLAGASEDEQLAMLDSTLEQIDSLPKIMQKMVRNWINGTPDRLTDLFLVEMGGFEATFMDRLLYQRNQNWIPALEGLLDDNAEALVVVGAAHLVGDGSVIDLLEKAGYRVERVQ